MQNDYHPNEVEAEQIERAINNLKRVFQYTNSRDVMAHAAVMANWLAEQIDAPAPFQATVQYIMVPERATSWVPDAQA